jgi:hypothetical protein
MPELLNDFIARNLAGCMRVNPDYTEAEARELLIELYEASYESVEELHWVTGQEAKECFLRDGEERLRRAITG